MGEPVKLLVFGGTGAIGSAICAAGVARGWEVTAVSRTVADKPLPGVRSVAADPLEDGFAAGTVLGMGPYSAVCWAQGTNTNDSVYDADLEKNVELYRANCLYIVASLRALLSEGLLAKGSRLCVISSIWQKLARQKKLSYCMTKAALQGLVLSAAADLAADGHLINAVLPGALETPMTRKNLSGAQIESLTSATAFGRLASLEDVANLVMYLCSEGNTGITGQFIGADLGFSSVRIV